MCHRGGVRRRLHGVSVALYESDRRPPGHAVSDVRQENVT
jgi:hypothetical protein